MENFIAYNPVKVHFGRGVVGGLGAIASELGKRALLVYGKGSVLKNGSYQDTHEQLERSGIEVFDFSGIKPNPIVEDVDAGSDFGRKNNVDLVVAVGGGSAIDSAKIMAVCIAENCKAWDVHKGRMKITKSLPIMAVLTLAATATEMNNVSVVQNNKTKEKFGFRHPLIFPRHSFLDPVYTMSVPPDQTAYGIVDLVAHALESYFGAGDASLSDRFVESIILEAMAFGPPLLKDPGNYELRAKIMWAASNALNGLTAAGRANSDFTSHALGHQLSLLYDTPHAASLSIAFPAWMKHMKSRISPRLEKLGQGLFSNPDPENTIAGLENFFIEVNCPVRLQEIGLDRSNRTEIVELMNRNRSNGKNPENHLNDSDREAIVDRMLDP